MKTAFWVHSPSPHELCGCSSRGKGLRLGQSHGRERGEQSPRSGGAGGWLPEGAGGKLGGCSAPQDPHLGRLSGAALMGTGCAAGQRQASEGSPSWPSFAQLALLPSCTGCCLLLGQSHWSYRAWATSRVLWLSSVQGGTGTAHPKKPLPAAGTTFPSAVTLRKQFKKE